ncbi:MAG: hypothetical protein E7254_05095 [Lachnospiraceae bacterium]|nr:hypothetical protein [Lachnospiraceae bacterium]
MLKRELIINFKNFVIWTGVLLALFLVVFLMYPSLIASNQMDEFNDMMEMFPPELLKAFNMDISGIDTAFGWMKTEGFVFVLLVTGVYGSILGSNIVLKEENDKTIEYLNSLPVTRKQIVIQKVAVAVFYIVLMVGVLLVFNGIGLHKDKDFDTKQFVLLSITPIFSTMAIFAISLFVSTFTHKTKKVFGISLGIVFVSYFLNTISEMSDKTKFFKYFSVFTLADIRNVITKVEINPIVLIVTVVLTLAFTVLSVIRYERKELV